MKIVRGLLFVLLFALIGAGIAPAQPVPRTENVIFVMADGLRWQEVFGGADKELMNKENGGLEKVEPILARYWRDTPEARREALMPFVWSVIARQGQIYGNQWKGSAVQVTNGLNFSYPGYSETLCGVADPRVNSNDKVFNPNVNVLEWLNQQRSFHGRVAAFGAWDRFIWILNRERSDLFINAGYEPMTQGKITPTFAMLNRLKAETIQYWGGEPFDSLTFETALEYLKTRKPRVLFVCLGEPDEWAHEGMYDKYLDSARNTDACVKTLWETAQSMRRYRGKTTLIFSADHGRGNAPVEWKGHGQKVKGSENIWMVFLGPDTPALGEQTKTDKVTENQMAATVAALLGKDYCAAIPQAGKPITSVYTKE